MKERIVLGIGNPGEEYAATRHNIGWRVLDLLASRSGVRFGTGDAIRAETAEARVKNATLYLVKPQTYVNRSGEVIPALRRRRDDLEQSLLVVCDDVNLALGRLRIRKAGSSGGHNGIDSLIASMGSGSFPRLRIGVDGATGSRLKDHVLSEFDPSDAASVDEVVHRAADAVTDWALSGISHAMNEFNREPEEKNGS